MAATAHASATTTPSLVRKSVKSWSSGRSLRTKATAGGGRKARGVYLGTARSRRLVLRSGRRPEARWALRPGWRLLGGTRARFLVGAGLRGALRLAAPDLARVEHLDLVERLLHLLRGLGVEL